MTIIRTDQLLMSRYLGIFGALRTLSRFAVYLLIWTAGVAFIATPARGSVEVVSVSSTGATNPAVLRWVHMLTPVVDPYLTIGISTHTNPAHPGSGVVSLKVNGQLLQPIGWRHSPCPQCYAQMTLYGMVNPPGGNVWIEVSLLYSVTHAVGGATYFSGVNQLRPTGAFFSSAGSVGGPPPFLIVSDSVPGDRVVDVIGMRPSAGYGFPGVNQTYLWAGRAHFGGQHDIGASSTEPAGTATEMNWNLAVPSDWALGAVAVRPALLPTAASVSVGGRVLTARGTGLPRARISISNAMGMSRTAITNGFGWYQFDAIEVGQTYFMTVSSKGSLFAEPTRAITVNDELTAIDFVALDNLDSGYLKEE